MTAGLQTVIRIPTLQTERLRLRAPRAEDYEAYAAFRASPRAATVGGPNTRDQAFQQFCALIGHWQVRGWGRWVIADRATDLALGTTGLYDPDGWPEPELAWSLFEHAEGKGIAFEAARAARRHAYEALGFATLISCVTPQNTRSAALARRMGCTFEGTVPHETLGAVHVWRHPAPDALDKDQAP